MVWIYWLLESLPMAEPDGTHCVAEYLDTPACVLRFSCGGLTLHYPNAIRRPFEQKNRILAGTREQ